MQPKGEPGETGGMAALCTNNELWNFSILPFASPSQSMQHRQQKKALLPYECLA